MLRLTVRLLIAVRHKGQLWIQKGVAAVSTYQSKPRQPLTFILDPAGINIRVKRIDYEQNIKNLSLQDMLS
jgi:hypothetical protein